MENKNLELWDKVEKTNPAYTKKANVKGNNITSIAPQYQIKQATEQFGSYGSKWGFKNMEFDFSLKDIGMASFKAKFFYPNGEFEIVNSVQLYKDNAKLKIDDDFAKKVETDTLTKALSKLGFSADIFLGKFDDVKYVQEMTNKFSKPVKFVTNPKVSLDDAKDLKGLAEAYKALSKEQQVEFKDLKDALKLKLK
tara:strand:- start:1721 stop:2305 length:585 start_codon:yes stop_codon:yes gene_type:complete